MIKWVWKSFFALHLLSNSAVFGLAMAYVLNARMCSMNYIHIFKKIIGLSLALSGLSGIVLLSILSYNGMNNLFANPIGISIVFMLLGYILVIFIASFGFLYKGSNVDTYRKIFGIIGLIYMIVYVVRVFLVS